MDHSLFGVQLIAPLLVFGGLPGDQLIVRVGHEDPITLLRSLPPNYGVVSDAIAAGLVFPLNPQRRAEDLLRLLAVNGEPWGVPPGSPPLGPPAPERRRVRHLTVLR